MAFGKPTSTPLLLLLLLPLLLVRASAPAGPWSSYILAPASRTVRPTGVYRTTGNVTLLAPGDIGASSGGARLSGAGASITLDFGKEIGGFLSFDFGAVDAGQTLRLAFTESPVFVGPVSDSSTLGVPGMNRDGALAINAPAAHTTWTLPARLLRGGFRYATLYLDTPGVVAVANFSTEFNASPHSTDLRDYSGYFYSNDDLLNRIWYAGVYTIQLTVVPINTGRQIPIVATNWANNASLGHGDVTIVDGAKRDRAVWPGDMGIAVPTAFVGTYDLEPVKNALTTMVQTQNPNGAFAEAGPPLLQQGSDTYHGWTLIGIYNYYLYTGDIAFVKSVWHNYTFAVSYLASRVGPTGIFSVSGVRDWGRLGQGGQNAEANAIYYHVLNTAAFLAAEMNDTALSAAYTANATALKSVFNSVFWVPSAGMFKDNTTTAGAKLFPQDANSLAIVFNLTTTSQTNSISSRLTERWGPFGAEAPELPLTVSPFIGGFELEAHFRENATRALDFVRLEWGYAVTTNLSVQSSLLEGWTTNGSLYYRSYQGYGYDASYTSHAHGWSSGPTSLLSFYVVGLKLQGVLGKTWSFEPQPGDLTKVQGGYETTLGRFQAGYTVDKLGVISGWFSVPANTTGVATIPGKTVKIGKVTYKSNVKSATSVVVEGVAGGNHTFTGQL